MTFRDYSKYEVYEDGRIYSYKSKKFLKPGTNQYGYQVVGLTDNEGKRKTYRLNRLIYETFSGSPIPYGLQVNHINEIKTDNRFENLNLMTPKENVNWGTGIKRKTKIQSKKVGAFKNGELVMTFSSANEAGRNGFQYSHIVDCCNGKRKTHRGFEWRYL